MENMNKSVEDEHSFPESAAIFVLVEKIYRDWLKVSRSGVVSPEDWFDSHRFVLGVESRTRKLMSMLYMRKLVGRGMDIDDLFFIYDEQLRRRIR